MLPDGKRVKTETSLSPRGKMYKDWLKGLQKKLASDVASQKMTSKRTEDIDFRGSKFLNFMTRELEHQLELDAFTTDASEQNFWDSIQNMAKQCGVNLSDFNKFCDVSECRDVIQTLHRGIPQLVDKDVDASWSEKPLQSSMRYSNMPSCEVSQKSPGATPKQNPCIFTQNAPILENLDVPKYQRHIYFSSNNRQHMQGQNVYPLGSMHSTLSMIKTSPLHDNISTQSIANINPLKKGSTQCFSLHLSSYSSSQLQATLPEICRKRSQRKRAMSYNHLSANIGSPTRQLRWNTNAVETSDLQLLVEKELKPSDVGSLGRIILPKRQAEEKLPHLESKEGLTMLFQDIQTMQTWELKFRFWPNNKTRMYVLEYTGNFVKLHDLKEGDLLILYKNAITGTYVISGKKTISSTCEGINNQLNFPVQHGPSQNANSNFETIDLNPTKSIGDIASTIDVSLPLDEGNSKVEITDMMAYKSLDMDDSVELFKTFTEIGAEGRTIDEIFDFKT
ncbi:hypothetical protein KP509_20G000700 [Ceratopteris richardii]|nr:hypothetical protein KP509_20G000700 [Ceratopteris richardii]